MAGATDNSNLWHNQRRVETNLGPGEARDFFSDINGVDIAGSNNTPVGSVVIDSRGNPVDIDVTLFTKQTVVVDPRYRPKLIRNPGVEDFIINGSLGNLEETVAKDLNVVIFRKWTDVNPPAGKNVYEVQVSSNSGAIPQNVSHRTINARALIQ